MRKCLYILIIVFSLMGCQDVIEVDLDTEPPRLTVDALIRIDTSESITKARIKVGLSSSFFEANQAVQVNQMIIQNLDYVPSGPLDQNFIILNETQLGIYEGSRNTAFFTSGELNLTIDYNGEFFLAKTRFAPSVPFNNIIQGDATLFSGDETELIVSFTDNVNRDDFYIFDFDFNEYLVSEDEFYQGQEFEFSYFYDNLKVGQTVTISILGADESFYKYMDQLIVQSGNSQGPFQVPVATVRGNLINVTGIDNTAVVDNVQSSNNFALGYFAVVQEFKQQIMIE